MNQSHIRYNITLNCKTDEQKQSAYNIMQFVYLPQLYRDTHTVTDTITTELIKAGFVTSYLKVPVMHQQKKYADTQCIYCERMFHDKSMDGDRDYCYDAKCESFANAINNGGREEE